MASDESEIEMTDNESVVDESENKMEVESEAEEVDPLVGSGVTEDPYLLAEAEYIKSEHRWKNKQRTLVFGSRGIEGRTRHLMEDLRRFMPHHKAEPKFERTANFQLINEVCELKSCNNAIFFEARKHGKHCYMHVARVPHGPTMKFAVLNVHTSAEIKLSGNCLMGSRPLLCFDTAFDSAPHLRLMKELFMQTMGTPRNHPKSKPFYDHVISFQYLDNKIWFRHYQISPETADDAHDPEKQQLTEIGPRFVLDPINILEGSFGGRVIYSNPKYVSPTLARRQQRNAKAASYSNRLLATAAKIEHRERNQIPEDPLEDVFE